MEKKMFPKALVILMALFFCCSTGQAQAGYDQYTACPGWYNPANFTAGGVNVNNWSGQAIIIDDGTNPNSPDYKPCPNPLTGVTGVTAMGATYTASQLAGVTSGGCSSSLPNDGNQFLIISNLTGHDPNTGNNLPYVPTQFNTNDTTPGVINTNLLKSIRIGDGCDNGTASGGTGNGYSGAALYYTMKVTPDNAMLYLYYAIVAQAPGHGQRGNPTFVIRVTQKNAAGQREQINDTLAYYISSTPSTDHSTDCPNM